MKRLFLACLVLCAVAGPAALAQVPAVPAAPVTAAPEPVAAAPDIAKPSEALPFPSKSSATQVRARSEDQTAEPIRIALIVTLAALIPALAICMTPFIRIVVVQSMIRHGLGMPETPPNQVLISLALLLTVFVMSPVVTKVNSQALQPFLAGSMSVQTALTEASGPMREFMLRQVNDSDVRAVYQMSRQPLPKTVADIGVMQATSAFMLNELRVSFRIGFVILLPFLLIDLVVSSILLSLGMLMVPPTTLSLPIKVLMFVLIDGWSLVLQGVVGSFR